MNLFKNTLAEALTSQKINATQFADLVGINRSQASKFLTGPDLPKAETLVSMCQHLPQSTALNLAKSWVYERVGPAIASQILATHENAAATPLQAALDVLPGELREAFVILITTARDDMDFSGSMVRLAEFLRPAENKESLSPDKATRSSSTQPCVTSAPLPATSPTTPAPQIPANIVPLPPPPVLGTLLHDTLAAETTTAPPVTATRTETTYAKKNKHK